MMRDRPLGRHEDENWGIEAPLSHPTHIGSLWIGEFSTCWMALRKNWVVETNLHQVETWRLCIFHQPKECSRSRQALFFWGTEFSAGRAAASASRLPQATPGTGRRSTRRTLTSVPWWRPRRQLRWRFMNCLQRVEWPNLSIDILVPSCTKYQTLNWILLDLFRYQEFPDHVPPFGSSTLLAMATLRPKEQQVKLATAKWMSQTWTDTPENAILFQNGCQIITYVPIEDTR